MESICTNQTAMSASNRPAALQWFLHDAFYIAMLVLALIGLVFRLALSYWVILIPVFGARHALAVPPPAVTPARVEAV